jgi:DNA-binding MarR family transcriptional regulator
MPEGSMVLLGQQLEDDGGPALAAWRAFLSAHSRVMRVLEAELLAESQMALADFDVLCRLAEAPDQSLRMHDLADSVLLSRSGVTRLVDRLVRLGYVARRPCPGDHRGKLAVLTPAGLERTLRASPVHMRGVSAQFIDRLSAEELLTLRTLMARLG